MSTKTWSKENIMAEFPSSSHLNDLIREIEYRAEGAQSVVSRISVNGLKLSEKDESRLASCPIEEVNHIEVTTILKSDLIQDTVESCRQFIGAIEVNAVQASEVFRSEDLNAAFRLLMKMTDDLYTLHEALTHTRQLIQTQSNGENPLGLDQGARDTMSNDWSSAECEFLRVAQNMIDGFQKRDFNLVSDLIEYDVSEILNRWKGLLECLSDKLRLNCNSPRQNLEPSIT